MPLKVALLGVYHESNTFVDTPTTLNDFEKGHYLTGENIRNEYQHAHHEIGGILEVMEKEGIEVEPLIYAEATPGGIITSKTYHELLTALLQFASAALPFDGCLVVPHGAAVSEDQRDMDGHWLKALRAMVGKIPVIGTLDPHANVSEQMVSSTDALISYKTNPHIDQRQTGMAAARLMVAALKKEVKPRQVLMQLPLAISIEQQQTSTPPCRELYALAKEMENDEDILSISINLGFPYADVEEMGTSVIVVSNNNIVAAERVCEKLSAYIMERQQDFVGKKRSIESCIEKIRTSKKPVLVLDMGDNIGGGAPGNNTVLLEAFEKNGQFNTFICVHDPAAVLHAEQHKAGQKFSLPVTNHENRVRYYDVSLLQLAKGQFTETSPRHGGQVNFDMGNIAVVRTSNGTTIMLTSLRVSPFSLKQITSFNISPADFDVIVAKGVNAPIAAYAPVCSTIIQVDTPGVTQAEMTLFPYKYRRRPFFPFETVVNKHVSIQKGEYR